MIWAPVAAWLAVVGAGTHGKPCAGVRSCGWEHCMWSQAGARPSALGGKRGFPLAKQATAPGAARASDRSPREVMQRCAGTGPADPGPRKQTATAGCSS